MRIAFLLLLAPLAALAQSGAEASGKSKIARLWMDHARWAAGQQLRDEASAAVERARLLEPAAEGLAALAESVAALPADPPETPPKEFTDRRRKTHRGAARLYDKLARLRHDAKEEARFQGYLVRAIELDPTKARVRKAAALVKKLAGNKARAAEAGRLLVALRDSEAGDGLAKLELDLARSDVAMIKNPGHSMVGYISLPKGWKAGRTWKVLVTVDGAGSNFLGSARKFARTRGSRPYIVLAPCGFANTNPPTRTLAKYPYYTQEVLDEGRAHPLAFDLAGLDALLTIVRDRFGGDGPIGITGFSGGGNLCYGFLVRHPTRVAFAAPACANFAAGYHAADARQAENGGPPIHILTGAKDQHREFTFGKRDQPGIEPQTDAAQKFLEEHAFRNVRRTMLPGVGHSNCPDQVWAFADETAR